MPVIANFRFLIVSILFSIPILLDIMYAQSKSLLRKIGFTMCCHTNAAMHLIEPNLQVCITGDLLAVLLSIVDFRLST